MIRDYRIIFENTSSTKEIISVDEAKTHLRITHDEHDILISSLISLARQVVERDCRLSLIKRNVIIFLDKFPAGELELPYGPAESIDYIKYYNQLKVLETINNNDLDIDNINQVVRIANKQGVWPATYEIYNSVEIKFAAGFDADKIPQQLIHAMKLLITAYYDNPSDLSAANLANMPHGYSSLIFPYSVYL